MDITKVINEEIKSFQEGSGDRYAQQRFGIPDTGEEFEKRWQQKRKAETNTKQNGRLVARHLANGAQTNIYANPPTLENFEAGVRALSDREGNLYVVQLNNDTLHTDMHIALKLPSGDMNTYGLWMRVASSNRFTGTHAMKEHKQDNPEEVEFLREIVARRNPRFQFIV